MRTFSVHDYPLEDGDAVCDAKFRVRLPSNWASYYLKRNCEEAEGARLVVTSLNREDILLFHSEDFIAYRTHLTEAGDQDDVLDSLRLWGGEAQLDRNGRFILPSRVRTAFPDLPGTEIKIISRLPVCLVSLKKYTERNQKLEQSDELHNRAKLQFVQSLKPQQSEGRL